MGTADLQVSGRQRGIARAPSKGVNMDALTAQGISRLQGRLVAERDAIRTRIAARGRDIQETVQEESGVGDAGDESTRIYDREDETDPNALDEETLEQLARPLARIYPAPSVLTQFSP